MKKINKIFFVLLIFFPIFSLVSYIGIKSILTDSGFDYSYDSGSSSNSSSSSHSSSNSSSSSHSSSNSSSSSHSSSNSSSHDNSYNSNSSSSSSSSSGTSYNQSEHKELSKEEKIGLKTFYIIMGLIAVAVSTYVLILSSKAIYEIFEEDFLDGESFFKKFTKITYNEMNENDIQKIIPGFDSASFISNCVNTFITVQEDWSNFNYDGLRSNLSDELYNQYEMQLSTLSSKGQKNVMKNFHLKKCVIEKVRFENNLYYVDAKLLISFKDYIMQGRRVVRGSAFKKCKALYSLTFVSSNDIMNTCPSCGATINSDSSQVCEYCKSTIVHISDKWVLTKKRILKQFDYDNPVTFVAHIIKSIFKNFFKIIRFIIQFILSVGLCLVMLGGSLHLLWKIINLKL